MTPSPAPSSPGITALRELAALSGDDLAPWSFMARDASRDTEEVYASHVGCPTPMVRVVIGRFHPGRCEPTCRALHCAIERRIAHARGAGELLRAMREHRARCGS